MTRFRKIAPLMAASALIGLAGCAQLGLGGSHEEAAAPPAAPPPAAAPAPAPAPMPMTEMTPQTIREAQTALKQQGFYRGRVDGKFGPASKSAVTAFQQKNGLQTTGTLDQPTLQALHVGA